MSIWDLCIKRPVFTVMLVSAPLVLGIVAYNNLGVDLFPNVELPVVVVTATMKGTSVEEMETSVTKPLEQIINTVNGIDELRSTTKEGISLITIQFFLSKDRDVAAQEVRDKISTIMAQLPQGIDPPIIDKFDINAMPVMTIAVSGGQDRKAQEITEIARKRVKEDLESISGVGAVILVGGRQRAVNIYVDTDKLTSYHLSIEQVRQSLISQNLELPGGRVDRGQQELVLRTMGRVETPAEFNDLIIANQNGHPVRIRDIGRVVDSHEEPRGMARLNGNPAVSLIVQKQSGANTVEVVEAVKKRLERLKAGMPPDIETMVVRDQSKFIVRSIDEVKFHLVIAAVLVGCTILLFIQDWRTTIIATLSIPASIVSTFAFMYWMGYTLNNIVMLGLIMAVGIVIDDAVVIHENIFRHMEEYGHSARVAAGAATREIALAVVATTMSLLVIFLPIIFMQGRIGRFFSSFGATVAFAIFMSMCISFTMTPMLCSRFLVLKKGHKGSKSGFFWRAVDGGYGGILRWSLRHRWAIVLSCAGLLGATPLLFRMIGFDFIPRDDQSEFEVAVTMPEGWSLQQADETFKEIEEKIAAMGGVTDVFSSIGDTTGRVTRGQGDVTSGNIYARLVDLEERTIPWYDVRHWFDGLRGVKPDPDRHFTQFQKQADARVIMAKYPDLRVSVQDVSAFQASGFRQSMIDFNLRGPDLKMLQLFSDEIMAWMRHDQERLGLAREKRKQPELSNDQLLAIVRAHLKDNPQYYYAFEDESYFVDVDTSLTLRKPELRVIPDRKRASDLGIPIQTIASTLNVLVGGEPVSKYKENDEQYDVWLRAEHPFRDQSQAISRLMVPSPKAELVQLGSVANLKFEQGPATIDRFAMQRQVVVTANLADNKALGDAVKDLSAYVKSMELPAEYRGEFLGRAKTLSESNLGFLVAFLMSFLFMYMILGAQFESFIHPITILLALPLTLPFAIISLMLLRTNLDIYAMFGLFMLFGIVKKNGILQVDYTNVLIAKGLPRDEAILEANHTRLRPILMTTVMLIAAMVPIAIAQGPGAACRASLAKVILGGQTLSLLLTLLVTPVAYSLWDDLAKRTSRLARRVRGSKDEGPAVEGEEEKAASEEAPATDEARAPGPSRRRNAPATAVFDRKTVETIVLPAKPSSARSNGNGEDVHGVDERGQDSRQEEVA
jgi:HAE1 family hydrophobic/amphiphilic exporter-1